MNLEHIKKLSIITVVYNAAKVLEKTIESILLQKRENLEFIVVDGASNDGTIDIIKKYEDHITHWISEKDTGIYNAMNKGIELASGELLLFMNAGDLFEGNVLDNSINDSCFLPVYFVDFFKNLKEVPLKNYRLGIPTSHQGIVFHKSSIRYDEKYKIASDYDYFIRNKEICKFVPVQTDGYVYYDNDGFSNQNYIKRDKEVAEIIRKYFGLFWSSIFTLRSLIKTIIKKVMKRKLSVS